MTVVATFEIEALHDRGTPGVPLPEPLSDPTARLPLCERRRYVRTFDRKAIALQRIGKRGTDAPRLGNAAPHVDRRAATGDEPARVLDAMPDDLALAH